MQLETIPRAGRAVGLAASACVLVGASVPVTGLLDGYPVLSAQAVRYGIGAVLLLGWLVATGRRVPVPSAKDLVGLSVMVGFGMLGFNAAILVGQRYATPGFIAAMLGASPLVLAVVAPALRGRRPSPYAVVGAVVVGLGVVVLSGGGSWHGPGLALALLVMACEVAFTLGGVGVVARLGAVAASMWSCVLAAVGGAVAATFLDGTAAWPAPTATEVVAIVVLGSLVTAVAFGCWYTGVSVLGADRAGVLVGLMRAGGGGAAGAWGRQPLTVVAAGGALLVAAGCALGLARPPGAPRSGAGGSGPSRVMRRGRGGSGWLSRAVRRGGGGSGQSPRAVRGGGGRTVEPSRAVRGGGGGPAEPSGVVRGGGDGSAEPSRGGGRGAAQPPRAMRSTSSASSS